MTPNSDKRLDCQVNLKDALKSPGSQWDTTPLVTDLQIMLDGESDPAGKLARMRAKITGEVCTYFSGGQVRERDKMLAYPNECIEKESVPPKWLMPAPYQTYVNLGRRDVRQLWANMIVNAVKDRGFKGLMLDNIVHPSANAAWFPWLATCDFLQFLRTRLRSKKMRLLANVAVAPVAMSNRDVGLLAKSVDGILLEMPLVADARSTAEKVRRQIEIYRRWLGRGKIVVLIPLEAGKGYTLEEARLIAAYAMMIREPRDALFVSALAWQALPDWATWPEQFGKPLKPAVVTEMPDAIYIGRRFERSTISIRFSDGVVTIDDTPHPFTKTASGRTSRKGNV